MKEGRITRRKMMETALTLEKLQPILEDLRDQIKSSIKASETVLRKEFGKEFQSIRDEMREMKSEMRSMNSEICSMQAAILENGRAIRENRADLASLKEEMHAMEERLAEKIDGNTRRIDELTKSEALH